MGRIRIVLVLLTRLPTWISRRCQKAVERFDNHVAKMEASRAASVSCFEQSSKPLQQGVPDTTDNALACGKLLMCVNSS